MKTHFLLCFFSAWNEFCLGEFDHFILVLLKSDVFWLLEKNQGIRKLVVFTWTFFVKFFPVLFFMLCAVTYQILLFWFKEKREYSVVKLWNYDHLFSHFKQENDPKIFDFTCLINSHQRAVLFKLRFVFRTWSFLLGGWRRRPTRPPGPGSSWWAMHWRGAWREKLPK